MNEKQLTIEQVGKIMGWSYPTALKFANRHGEIVGRKWQVPSSTIRKEIDKRGAAVKNMEYRFANIEAARIGL